MNDTVHQAWLDGLKVGDEVAVGNRLSKVARLTNTLIVVGGSGRFRKQNGRQYGNHYGQYLMEPTQEVKERIERYRLRDTLRAADWLIFPLATLRKVNELVEAASGKATG